MLIISPPPSLPQGMYSVARSAGAAVFESNVHCNFSFRNGSGLVADIFFGLDVVSDGTQLTADSTAAIMGFDCGAPPNPRVCRSKVGAKVGGQMLGINVGSGSRRVEPLGFEVLSVVFYSLGKLPC